MCILFFGGCLLVEPLADFIKSVVDNAAREDLQLRLRNG